MDSLYELCIKQVTPHPDLEDKIPEDIYEYIKKWHFEEKKEWLLNNLVIVSPGGTVCCYKHIVIDWYFNRRILERHWIKLLKMTGKLEEEGRREEIQGYVYAYDNSSFLNKILS